MGQALYQRTLAALSHGVNALVFLYREVLHLDSDSFPPPPLALVDDASLLSVFALRQLLVMEPGGGVCQLKRMGTSAQGTPGGCLLGL